MKSLIGLLALTFSTLPAHAIHMYASYSCKTAGNVELIYDGPGSNYAFGGFSHFYLNNKSEALLSIQKIEEDGSKIDEQITDEEKLEVIFEVTENKQISESKIDKVDTKTCEGFEYEHSEWKSNRTIKILDISAKASKKMGIKSGDTLTLECDESQDEPVRCDNQ